MGRIEKKGVREGGGVDRNSRNSVCVNVDGALDREENER